MCGAKIHKCNRLSILVVLSGLLLGACTSVQKEPLEELSGTFRERYAGEEINGSFPDAVYIKTRTQTFNSYHYYILKDGLIWYKSIDPEKYPEDWRLFPRNGLPNNSWYLGFTKTRAVAEISADADELIALSGEGGFYRYCFDRIIARNSNVWLDRYGWPKEKTLYLDGRTVKNRAWALGKRNSHVLYYEDPFGNQHHNGTMEIATVYVLLEDGQEICYADTGLPADFSHNFRGPERGAFKAAALSASASTMFMINEAGEMYTRLADFDTTGSDPMFFKYTYIPYTSGLPGTDYFSNLSEWGLPAEEWRAQPRISLSGQAAITRHITILQNGQGNGARELRVAGLNEKGETGYWTKAIFADTWEFEAVPLFFSKNALLDAADPQKEGERGPSPDKSLKGSWWNGDTRETEWEYTIPNFNILEGSCDLHIRRQGETCTLKLHPVELWTYISRDYLPGRNGPPKMFFATLDIPPNAFKDLSQEFAALLREKYQKNDKVLFRYIITASDHYVFMREIDTPDEALLLTDGTISDYFPEFRRTWYVENIEELRHYDSPELVFSSRSSVTREGYGELRRKTEANRAFRDRLRRSINGLNMYRFTAFTINSTYLPMDYFSRITFLNYIDVPKIKTVTRFGEQVVLTNAAYIDIISNARIMVFRRIIDLLEIRIRSYSGMLQKIENGEREAAFPPWFADNISGYWTIAGLPQKIRGEFFCPSPRLVEGTNDPVPAVLSFKDAKEEGGMMGWYFTIDEDMSFQQNDKPFALYIDPRNSIKTIYARRGRTPRQHTLRLSCTLYANSEIYNTDADTSPARDIIQQSLIPFMKNMREGIGVQISFDGTILEIKEYPPTRIKPLIFRGRIE